MQGRDETDLDYFSRRAMEESRAAASATTRQASTAHRHMAAAYASKLRDEQIATQRFSDMLEELDLADDDPRLDEPEACATG